MSNAFRTQRRWRLPPPYLRDSEPLEGFGILSEIGGSLGLLLWQSARDAGLWALTPGDQREGLFTPEAEPRRLADLLSIGKGAESLEEPLCALASMLSHPADVAPEAVMLACDRISRWAEHGDRLATALMFAQASALAMPAASRNALRVGRLARRQGQYSRAEGWLQRAVLLARQEEDRVTHAAGYTALGNLYIMRGNLPSAERHHLRALRIADRHSLAARRAAALHDLFVVCAGWGRIPEAVGYARRAVVAYGPKHEQLPMFVHDVALMWLERGEFSRALPVLQAALPHIPDDQRLLALASTARAAGSLGDEQLFRSSRDQVLALAHPGAERENHAVALLNVARGAAALGQRDSAISLAQRAATLARRLREHKVEFSAESVLQSIRAEERSADAIHGVAADTSESDVSADALVDELLACFAG